MNKSHQVEPEIREDLQGRIEVFDQSIRSFEKRLRAVERRLSIEGSAVPQAGKSFSANFSDPFPEEDAGFVAAGASIFPQGPSVFPEASVPLHGNALSLNSAACFSEGNIPAFALSAVLPSNESSNFSMDSVDNSSDPSGTNFKIKTLNSFFSGLLENFNSLQVSLSELSDFVHNDLKPEIEKLNLEVQNLKTQENATDKSIKQLESRIDILENQNRFTLGSIKIPLEISGIAGSSILFLTGFLVWVGRWDIIRSAYFPIGLAAILAGAVFMKFYVLNSKKKALVCND